MPGRLDVCDHVRDVVVEYVDGLAVGHLVGSLAAEHVDVFHLEAELPTHAAVVLQLPGALGNLLGPALKVELGEDEALVAEENVEARLGADLEMPLRHALAHVLGLVHGRVCGQMGFVEWLPNKPVRSVPAVHIMRPPHDRPPKRRAVVGGRVG